MRVSRRLDGIKQPFARIYPALAHETPVFLGENPQIGLLGDIVDVVLVF
jgi:hypothetical protein